MFFNRLFGLLPNSTTYLGVLKQWTVGGPGEVGPFQELPGAPSWTEFFAEVGVVVIGAHREVLSLKSKSAALDAGPGQGWSVDTFPSDSFDQATNAFVFEEGAEDRIAAWHGTGDVPFLPALFG